MAVLVEMENGTQITEIFKNIRNLSGSAIGVERDLNKERQVDKKALLQVKKTLWNNNQSHRISIRNDRMRIGDKWFSWNKDKNLVCGSSNGMVELQNLYGNNLGNISFNYKSIVDNINQKN